MSGPRERGGRRAGHGVGGFWVVEGMRMLALVVWVLKCYFPCWLVLSLTFFFGRKGGPGRALGD